MYRLSYKRDSQLGNNFLGFKEVCGPCLKNLGLIMGHFQNYFNYFKAILHFFLEIGSFYNSPRVKQLSFTIFESIQPIF